MSRMFQSTKHPHVRVNRHGVCLVPNGHPDGVDYWGKSFDLVPLRAGLLPLEWEVEREWRRARAAKREAR